MNRDVLEEELRHANVHKKEDTEYLRANGMGGHIFDLSREVVGSVENDSDILA